MEYDALAEAYEFTVPDSMLSPAGSVAAFESVTRELSAGAVVLDCACGMGLLAVGLAAAGCEVCATDGSPAMVARTLALAAAHGIAVDGRTCSWAQLEGQGWSQRFDAVFCVGNSLTHASGQRGRRAALQAMGGVLRDGGSLVLTSRNWELQRHQSPGLQISERLIERDGRSGLLIYDWLPASSWIEGHHLDFAVVVLETATGTIRTYSERLTYWPFTYDELIGDLHHAGLSLDATTYQPNLERYLVSARPTESRARAGDRP